MMHINLKKNQMLNYFQVWLVNRLLAVVGTANQNVCFANPYSANSKIYFANAKPV